MILPPAEAHVGLHQAVAFEQGAVIEQDVGRAVGLDAARARAIVGSDEFASEVRERERHWRERGIAAVPTVVLNDSHVIEGAQPPEAFEQALRQAALSR